MASLSVSTVLLGCTVEREAPKAKETKQETVTESEQKIYCDNYQCGSDEFTKEARVTKPGKLEYFEFSPRGRIANGKGFVHQTESAEMYFRPGNQPSETKKVSFDEMWTFEYYADMDMNKRRSSADPLGEISFVYWNAGRFVLSLQYALAEVSEMPTRVLKDAKPTDVDRFTYRQIRGHWFILDSVNDRVAFEKTFELSSKR